MKKKIVIIGIVVTISILFIAGCTSSPQNGSDLNSNSNPPPQQTETEVLIPLADLTTTAKFYSFESEGVTIRYFAVKDSVGNIHVAIDACDVCYEAKKGYKQVGDIMHCIPIEDLKNFLEGS